MNKNFFEVKNVDFLSERKYLKNFFLSLKKLISENGFEYNEDEEFMIEIGTESCQHIVYILYSQPYAQQLMIGFDAFKEKSFAKRANTVSLVVNIYNVISDMKKNLDWFKFASKYLLSKN